MTNKLFVCLFLFLVACSPGDPNQMIAAGNAALKSTQDFAAAAERTEGAARIQKTEAARATADYFAYLETGQAVTQQAQNIRATDQAAGVTAWAGTLAANIQIQNVENLQAAEAERIRLDLQKRAVNDRLQAAGWWLLVGLVIIFELFLISLIWRYTLKYTVMYWDQHRPYILASSRPVLEAESPRIVDNNAVIDLLQRSLSYLEMKRLGDSNIIPRWDKIGETSPYFHSKVLSEMKRYDLITVSNGFTMIKHGKTVKTLLNEFQEGETGIIPGSPYPSANPLGKRS